MRRNGGCEGGGNTSQGKASKFRVPKKVGGVKGGGVRWLTAEGGDLD